MLSYCLLAGITMVLWSRCFSLPNPDTLGSVPDGFCSRMDYLLLTSVDAIQSASRLLNVFCLRPDVQELVRPDGSCQRYIDDVLSRASGSVNAAPASGVNLGGIQTTEQLAETLQDLLHRSSDLSSSTGNMLRVHHHCECPLTRGSHTTCPHRRWIAPLAGRYCSDSDRLFHETKNRIHSLVVHTNDMVNLMNSQAGTSSRPRPPSSYDALPVSDTVRRLTYSLVTLTNIVKQSKVTLTTVCHVCGYRPTPCSYLLV